jgi:8-oxo-dGTP pyrophosphatase MutT (NUDIX family)
MPGMLVFPGGCVDPEDGPAGSDEAFERAARRECLEEAGIALDDRDLLWFDTWITPSVDPHRYFTRFFLARLDLGAGEAAQAGGRETHEGRWATAKAHLRSWEIGRSDMPPPTLCTLLRLQDRTVQQIHEALERLDPRGPILPKKSTVEGDQLVIALPHDPEYATLPGQGVEIPKRVRELPSFFLRADNRWVPCRP